MCLVGLIGNLSAVLKEEFVEWIKTKIPKIFLRKR